MNGWKCEASNTGSATAMNSASASSFTTTRKALSVALSRVPAISRPATTTMMKIAGRLMIPPSSGPCTSACGSPIPMELQESGGIARPADRDRADHQRIFEDQRDADHPGDQLAEHRIGIGVGAARRRDHRRDFGIGERCAGADHAGDGEGQDDRRTGLARADADQGQDAGADDRADAERDEVRPATASGPAGDAPAYPRARRSSCGRSSSSSSSPSSSLRA